MILLEKYSEYITWNIDSLNVYVNFMIMLTGIVTIIVTASQFIRQQRISLFEKYTQRYQHIIEIMPEYIFEGKPLHKRDKEAVRAIRLYIDLCSEEFYLHQQKYLDKKVWTEWKGGMKIMFSYSSVKEVFNKNYKTTYKEFASFVEKELNKV